MDMSAGCQPQPADMPGRSRRILPHDPNFMIRLLFYGIVYNSLVMMNSGFISKLS